MRSQAALDANDADLAQSFVDLAADRGAPLPPELEAKVAAAVDEANSASAAAGSFASGLITGEPKDMAGFAGTALGDLFVFGDIRDAVREGSRYVSGENYDQLILGLSVRRHRHHRRHLCDGRRGDAGAARAHGGEGGAQDRTAQRPAGRLDRPLVARRDRLVGAEARRRLGHRARGRGARGPRGGQGREGGRSGASRQRRRHACRPRPARRPRSTGSSSPTARARCRGSPRLPRRRAARRARS